MAIPAQLAEGLKVLSQRERATLFMTLLAAFQTLLHRYTGLDDLVVGTPIANRSQIETEGLIGFFANTLVMHANLSGNPTFRELLGRVRESSLGAYANQELPFERLVETLAPERDLARSPIFQVFFNLLNMEDGSARELPGVTMEPIGVTGHTGSRFDLTLYAQERPEGIHLVLVYSTDLFDATVGQRLLDDLVGLIDRAATTPDARLSHLLLLDARGYGTGPVAMATGAGWSCRSSLPRIRVGCSVTSAPDAPI
jgi:aspartate racemase